jgi:hypothetical protein
VDEGASFEREIEVGHIQSQAFSSRPYWIGKIMERGSRFSYPGMRRFAGKNR